MRIMFKVSTQWESGVNICETDFVSIFEEKEVRFVIKDTKKVFYYSVKIKDEEDLSDIKKELFNYGKYKFTNHEILMSPDGKEWICINKPKEEENGHSK